MRTLFLDSQDGVDMYIPPRYIAIFLCYGTFNAPCDLDDVTLILLQSRSRSLSWSVLAIYYSSRTLALGSCSLSIYL